MMIVKCLSHPMKLVNHKSYLYQTSRIGFVNHEILMNWWLDDRVHICRDINLEKTQIIVFLDNCPGQWQWHDRLLHSNPAELPSGKRK